MADIKDIMGMPQRSTEAKEPKEAKPKEGKQERPKGVSREAYSLLYGTHPITPANLLKEVKKDEKKPAPTSVQVTYQFLPFEHQARKDGLQLSHWTRCYRDAAQRIRPADDGDYPYAKYDRRVMVYEYDDIEYETVIRPKFPEQKTGWSREETDYLLDMCKRLDLRFIVIADRWSFTGGPHRSVEDLKERYYDMAAELLVHREGTRELVANNAMVRQRYDAQSERERKALLQMTLTRSQQQATDEEDILAKAEVILQRRKAAAEATQSEGAPLMHPSSFSNATTDLPFFDRSVIPVAPPKPGVYMRRAVTDEALKKAIQEAPMQQQRVQKHLDSLIQDVGKVYAQPAVMTRATSAMWLALHSEALMLVNMRQRQSKVSLPLDDSRGKRGIKSKAPRHDDAIASASLKRQRSGK